MNGSRFRNRREAGRLLAAKLAACAKRPDVIVLAHSHARREGDLLEPTNDRPERGTQPHRIVGWRMQPTHVGWQFGERGSTLCTELGE
jgi:hypothetical protein